MVRWGELKNLLTCLISGYNNVLGKMSGRNKNIDIENALKLAASDGQITYNEIRQNLKK